MGRRLQLLGGEDRIEPYTWGNGFIANFGLGADRPWEPASASSPGWHKDGDFFRHFLDSPEQGLLMIGCGPTSRSAAADVHRARLRGPGGPAARAAVAGRAALRLRHYDDPIAHCSTFVETTGRLGDVVLMHPFMLHAVSQNHRGTARFITNPPIALKEPMRFDREPAEHSPVERAVLRALASTVDYRPSGAPGGRVPERVRRQERMREQDEARLAEASS